MTQLTPRAGDKFVDQDRRNGGRTVTLVARADPKAMTPAYWVVSNLETGRTSTIREDRIRTVSLYEFQED